MAASTGHSRELSRRWRLAQLSPYCQKDISVNPGVLHRSGKKQYDHQELPNSSLTNATCPTPVHPEKSVQGTQILSLWDSVRKGEHTIASTPGTSIFCILSSKPLSLAPFFAAAFVSRMHVCNHSALLRQKGLSPLFLGAVNFFQESEICSFSNSLLAQSVLVMLGKRCQESSLNSFFYVTSGET